VGSFVRDMFEYLAEPSAAIEEVDRRNLKRKSQSLFIGFIFDVSYTLYGRLRRNKLIHLDRIAATPQEKANQRQ